LLSPIRPGALLIGARLAPPHACSERERWPRWLWLSQRPFPLDQEFRQRVFGAFDTGDWRDQ
jgi:hypothetical protein